MAAHRVALGLRRARGMSTTGGLVPDRAPAAQNGRAAGPAPSAPSVGSGQAAAEVSGHARTRRLRSTRLRLLLPTLVALADALPTQLSDAQLAATARAVGAIAAAEHLGAQQRDLLSQAFRRGSMTTAELAGLAELTGAQDERIAEFTRSASPAELARYTELLRGDDLLASTRMRTTPLAAHADLTALKVDPDVWYIAQSNTLRHLHELELRLTTNLDLTSRERQRRAQTSSLLTGTATGLLVLLAFSAALLSGVRTSRRLRGLRGAALAVAYTELPSAITTLSRAEEPDHVRVALH